MAGIGFVYQCHKEDLSLFNCLKSIREYYPKSPIYLMCDNGNYYSKVAKYFNCSYTHYTNNSPVHRIILQY